MRDIKVALGAVAGAFFGLGLVIGLSVSVVIRRDIGYTDEAVQATVAHELVNQILIPTATSHVCPELPQPCPTVIYKVLPDVTGVLSDLGLVDYEMQLVDTKLENYIESTEGEYDWNLIGILSLHRSSHNYLLDAADEVITWFNLGSMTCPNETFEICVNHSTCRDCMSTFVGVTTENQRARHCINQMMVGR